MTESSSIPAGAPQTLWFQGIVEGRTVDSDAIQSACRDLEQSTGRRFELEFDGPNFSVLPQDVLGDGGRFDETRRADFADALRRVLAAAEPGSVESTLRCTAYFENEVAETVFGVEDGEPRAVGRVRPRAPQEGRMPRPEAMFSVDADKGRKILLIAPLALFVVFWAGWTSGILPRMFAESASDLELDAGPLDEKVTLAADSRWSWKTIGLVYEVEIRRGPEFPADPGQLDAALAAETSLIGRAALETLQSGGRFEIRLLDEEGKVLHRVSTNLVALLDDPEAGDSEAVVRVLVPGHSSARSLRLELESDK